MESEDTEALYSHGCYVGRSFVLLWLLVAPYQQLVWY